MSLNKLTLKYISVNEKAMRKTITTNAIEWGCLQDDAGHSCAEDAGSQLVSLVGVHQFRKELTWTKKVQTQPKWISVRVTMAFSHPCKYKLKSSTSRERYAATKLAGWPDDHLSVCLQMVLPLLSRRWWLLIFIALKQHESKTVATQNK